MGFSSLFLRLPRIPELGWGRSLKDLLSAILTPPHFVPLGKDELVPGEGEAPPRIPLLNDIGDSRAGWEGVSIIHLLLYSSPRACLQGVLG